MKVGTIFKGNSFSTEGNFLKVDKRFENRQHFLKQHYITNRTFYDVFAVRLKDKWLCCVRTDLKFEVVRRGF